MSYLFDSNALLWTLLEPGQIRTKAREVLSVPGTPRFFSAASVWEIEIKRLRGKLALDPDWLDTVLALGLTEIRIDSADGLSSARLPWHHRDPFDRLIVAHALRHGLTLATRDTFLAAYGVRLLAV